jgi:acyl-CoA thioesterase
MSEATSAAPSPELEADRDFDQATAVVVDTDGVGHARIGGEYGGFAGAHGGYVAALALRSMAQLVDDPQRAPRSLTIQLLASVRQGPLALHTQLSRAGRSMSTASVHLRQDERVVAVALGAFGAATASLTRRDARMPDVPAPEQCEPVILRPRGAGSFKHRAEHRSAAPPLPLSSSGEARLTVWIRMTEDRPVDALAACFLADAAPPALFATLDDFAAIPSADITLHFAASAGRAATADPWVLGVFASRDAGDGYAVEDGELWTRGGELIVHSRQLRRIL